MKHVILRLVLMGSVFILAQGALWPGSGEEYDIDKEIARVNKELSRVETERKAVKADRDKDQKEFAEYENRTKKIIESIRVETDSIKNLTKGLRKTVDSLAAQITGLLSSKQEYDLLQENLRMRLIAECDSFFLVAKNLPPLVSASLVSSIQLLKAELISKSVSNIEAMNRLVQIANDIEDVNSQIQVVQESSPVPDIRGAVNRLRIGCVYESLVDEKGTKAAVWNGYDKNDKPLWTLITNPKECADILKAIQIREGKSLPDFVKIPFQAPAGVSGGAK